MFECWQGSEVIGLVGSVGFAAFPSIPGTLFKKLGKLGELDCACAIPLIKTVAKIMIFFISLLPFQ